MCLAVRFDGDLCLREFLKVRGCGFAEADEYREVYDVFFVEFVVIAASDCFAECLAYFLEFFGVFLEGG